jgi:hypothetical protein
MRCNALKFVLKCSCSISKSVPILDGDIDVPLSLALDEIYEHTSVAGKLETQEKCVDGQTLSIF